MSGNVYIYRAPWFTLGVNIELLRSEYDTEMRFKRGGICIFCLIVHHDVWSVDVIIDSTVLNNFARQRQHYDLYLQIHNTR